MTFRDSLGAVVPWNALEVVVKGCVTETYRTWAGGTGTRCAWPLDTTVVTRPAYPARPGLTFTVEVDFEEIEYLSILTPSSSAMPRTEGKAPGHPFLTRGHWPVSESNLIYRHEVAGRARYSFRWEAGYGLEHIVVTVEDAAGNVAPLAHHPVLYKVMRFGAVARADKEGVTDWHGEAGRYLSAGYGVVVKGEGIRCPAVADAGGPYWAVMKVRCVTEDAAAAPWFEACETVFGDWYTDDPYVSRCTRYDG